MFKYLILFSILAVGNSSYAEFCKAEANTYVNKYAHDAKLESKLIFRGDAVDWALSTFFEEDLYSQTAQERMKKYINDNRNLLVYLATINYDESFVTDEVVFFINPNSCQLESTMLRRKVDLEGLG